MVGFGAPGTDVGEAGIEALPTAAAAIPAGTLEFTADRMRDGFTSMAVATVGGIPVASGSHQPFGGATEITGVACLPAYRRRGLGAAVTSALVEDAIDRGVGTVFLSAGERGHRAGVRTRGIPNGRPRRRGRVRRRRNAALASRVPIIEIGRSRPTVSP